jgi:hypothetical protein
MYMTKTYDLINFILITGDVSADPDADHAMDALAEYHLGTPGDAARQDSEMTRLYELHHGTV